jgi:ERCC4-type nuclease
MFIKIDSRERDLQNKLAFYISSIPAFRNLKVIVESLPIGDVVISHNDEDVLIMERKSIPDLLSSIKDGRYEEQSFRLNGLPVHNHNIMYIIEGDVNKINMFRDTKFEKLTLYSAIFSLNYYKGFSAIRTFSIDETALFICNCTSKLIKGETTSRKAFYANQNAKKNANQNSGAVNTANITKTISEKPESERETETDPENKVETILETNTSVETEENSDPEQSKNGDKDYISLVKKVKKENITVENIDEIMLCQIPGVSTATAVSIIKKYNSIAKLIKCLEENEKCLADVTNINGKGQSRKITKTSIANIIKFLLKK